MWSLLFHRPKRPQLAPKPYSSSFCFLPSSFLSCSIFFSIICIEDHKLSFHWVSPSIWKGSLIPLPYRLLFFLSIILLDLVQCWHCYSLSSVLLTKAYLSSSCIFSFSEAKDTFLGLNLPCLCKRVLHVVFIKGESLSCPSESVLF